MTLSRKDLDYPVAARRDYKAAILTPDDAAYAFAAHDAMCRDLLGTDTLVEGPEADGGIVTGRDCLTAVFAERERGDGGGMG